MHVEMVTVFIIGSGSRQSRQIPDLVATCSVVVNHTSS